MTDTYNKTNRNSDPEHNFFNSKNHTDVQNTITDSSVLTQMGLNNHEQILFCQDSKTGLKAIIAIHNTILGPSLGGLRMWKYANESEALTDVLRLSRGMTYKAAVSGLHLGGGKAVIIGDSRKEKSEALIRRFGQFVDSLNGNYITAEDVGITSTDMEWVSLETDHVTGLPVELGGGGDPGPVTAYGVYMGMKAAAKHRWGNDSLSGKKIGVEGIGSVGYKLIEFLSKEGAEIYACDLYQDRLDRVHTDFGTHIIDPVDFYDLNMDIYAPCALGATITDQTIERLCCSVIAGSANNQLKDERVHAKAVMEKGILYVPDFVINAGGLINVYSELEGYDKNRAYAKTEKIYDTVLDVINLAATREVTPVMAAMTLAEKRIKQIAELNMQR